MKTYSTKAGEIKRRHHVIDASDRVLGRLAADIAVLLMGKNKPIFTRNLDTGDLVTVVNAGKMKITGNKTAQKYYYRHSGYPGGLKSENLGELMETNPGRVIEFAVKGMLPPNRLRAHLMKKLTVYADNPIHTHKKDTDKPAENPAETQEQKG